MAEVSERPRCLGELHIGIQSRLGSALAAVELLTAAAPFCDPLLELARDDLRAALAALTEAQELERHVTKVLAGPRSSQDTSTR